MQLATQRIILRDFVLDDWPAVLTTGAPVRKRNYHIRNTSDSSFLLWEERRVLMASSGQLALTTNPRLFAGGAVYSYQPEPIIIPSWSTAQECLIPSSPVAGLTKT